MLAHVRSMGLRGIEGYPVTVELDLSNGMPGYATVGLPDDAIRESRERVVSALRNCGYHVPRKRITVNLAPAQSRKEGSHFDLPIALALLAASGQIPSEERLRNYCCVGELALDGGLRPVRGALSMALRAREEGLGGIIVPVENASEARAVGVEVLAGRSLREVAEILSGRSAPAVQNIVAEMPAEGSPGDADLSDVKGQALAKRALEIAAAGSHNLLLIGPPGIGKSMLARRLPGLLPPMSRGEVLEVTRIHSLRAKESPGLVTRRPFRDPHHTASPVSLIGGGPLARPGEASLAHGGVLFLDEVVEFSRAALEVLRQPLSDFKATIARARECMEYPARFILVAAANPCPCGFRGHPRRRCDCSFRAVRSYLSRLSGPWLDRVDLQVEMAPVDFSDWAGHNNGGAESSARVQERVIRARRAQRERMERDDFAANAYLSPDQMRVHCALGLESLKILERAAKLFELSARGLDRMLKVARTIADLAGSASIGPAHLAEAMQYRALDKAREA